VRERREARAPRLLPWAAAALALHAAAVVGAFVAARFEPPAPTHLPSVTVRLVRLPRPGPRPAGPPPAPAQPPRPTAAPAPTPAPTAAPAPREERPASPEAMPAPTRVPRPTPRPAAPTGGGRGGLSLGGGDTGGPPAVPEDFRFAYYVQRMLTLIESRWYKPPVPRGTRARVRFTILRDGRVQGIALEESSGVPSFDRAALRALYASNPLPPLPPAYPKPSITVHLTFAEAP